MAIKTMRIMMIKMIRYNNITYNETENNNNKNDNINIIITIK